ncbi:MAG: CBS domain-containing protein, partial [Planctomycetota bacterium]
TARPDSPLGRYADIALCYGAVEEACPLGLAPTASTACMLALGDALALTVMDMRQFSPEDYAAFHPGGALGRSLMKVEEAMTSKPGERLPVAEQSRTVREVLAEGERLKRRAGAVLLVDADGKLTGILTDGDLRRQVLADGDGTLLDRPVGEVMVRDPKRIEAGELASEALAIMNRYRIDELPVVDAAGRPVGLLDVQDLVGLKVLEDG